jgi:hypothetical protein
MTTEKHLSDRDRAEIAAHIDHMVDVLADRYGVEPHEVVDTVKWVREKKEHDAKMKNAALLAIIGVMVSAVMMALWEGFKTLSGR